MMNHKLKNIISWIIAWTVVILFLISILSFIVFIYILSIKAKSKYNKAFSIKGETYE